ncbi:putative very-long-chain 3-oxoacyl-CoA reductase [Rosa chinensis]|uniref:Putative very-long-chain 3-oxoacyl-CoA reductase n=1 Tax=Rosa chinensis TaxID=74649 RepID=A0A2P6RHC3_ROSCH|nr:putative very-long-chain 3-oxoacyl-CoA reductase [Rosa chinensis]
MFFTVLILLQLWHTNVRYKRHGIFYGTFLCAVKLHLRRTLWAVKVPFWCSGVATSCFVALHPQVKAVSSEYFADCNIVKPSNQAKDADLASKLWDFSLSMTNLK